MTYYIQIEDCQNNIEAIVEVNADSKLEAKYKALRALHIDDNLYVITKEDAANVVEEEGIIPIDEDGEEIEIEFDEEEL